MTHTINTPDHQAIAGHCAKWVASVIVKYNICPFARAELESQRIHYAVIDNAEATEALMALITECQRLDKEPGIATTLAIFPEILANFDDFLDFLVVAEELLLAQGYEGVYQLASFHPDYCFEGEASDDPANYTNRSPYPMLHLIREDAMEKALASYPNPEKIPQRNIEFTRRQGSAKMQALLDNCLK